MDTLYTLCRSADNRHALPLTEEEQTEVSAHKQAFFADEASRNPLVREILEGGEVRAHEMEALDRRGFLKGPATFFRTHELLRRTRRSNVPLLIGLQEYPRAAVVDFFARCVPNAKLQHVPWFSPARYTTSLALAWGITLLVAHLFGRESQEGSLFDTQVVFQLGVVATAVAVVSSALKSNRDPRYAAPWNSAVYLDVNAMLVRRKSAMLAFARKECVPQQKPFKQPAFYYALARQIETGEFELELARRMAKRTPPS